MKAAVSDILASRRREEGGLSKLVGVSLAAHIVIVAAVALMPPSWFNSVPVEPELMVISLGGPTGPSTTGTNAISGKRVDQVVEPTRPQPPQPPAAVKPDEMPPPAAKPVTPKPVPKTPPPTTAPAAATTKPPVTGAKVQQGTATTDTGATGTNTGLTITGGDGGGDAVDLNNFNREWVAKFKKAVEDVWQQNQGEAGRVELRFTILRDGRVQEALPGVISTTGSMVLQMASIRAIRNAKLPPLPADYSGDQLIIRLGFDYKR